MFPVILVIPALAILVAPAIWFVLGAPRYLKLRTDSPSEATDISIIIPARDEESNIATLLESIRNQSVRPLETIVVDDGSSDNTAEVAANHGARVIAAAALPAGWMGKPWACQQGAEAAGGNWLLFLDADLVLDKFAMAAMAQLCAKPDQVHSVCPYHTIKHPYEELSAFFNVLMLAGINAFAPGKSSGKNAALFGQCMLISRAHYQQVDGHHAVKDKALENFHLAKKLGQLGIARSCYLGKGMINMRMFPDGIGTLWSSWKKGFSGGAAHTAPRALLFSSLWISGMMLTIASLLLLPTPYASGYFSLLTAAAYLVHACQCFLVFRLAGTFSIGNALFFPISLLFYQVLFFGSLIDKRRGKKTEWKGRAVH